MAGFVKSFVFAILIAGVGCLRGLQTAAGARRVGDRATRAVVSGIILLVVVDGIFARASTSARHLMRSRPHDPIIRVEDLSAGYDDNVILHDLNFEVYARRGLRASSAARAAARARC